MKSVGNIVVIEGLTVCEVSMDWHASCLWRLEIQLCCSAGLIKSFRWRDVFICTV